MVGVFISSLLLASMSLSNAFLFPDIKRRSGSMGRAYKVAVLEEGPYLYSNGTGYVPDLLQLLSKSPASQQQGQPLQLEVLPVSSWSQLLSATRSARQIGFGLQTPALESPTWSRRRSEESLPTLPSSFKLVTKRRDVTSYRDERATRGSLVIVVRNSPVEYFLSGPPVSYTGPVHRVEGLAQAVQVLRSSSPQSVILTDAGSADYIAASQENNDLQSVCTKDLDGAHGVHFGFFGRDSSLIGSLNSAILAAIEGGELFALNSRYFPVKNNC